MIKNEWYIDNPTYVGLTEFISFFSNIAGRVELLMTFFYNALDRTNPLDIFLQLLCKQCTNCKGGKKFMEQIEVNKQSFDKSSEVSEAIAKPPESIAKDGNMNMIIENFGYFIRLFLENRKKVLLPYRLINYICLAALTKAAISSKKLRLRYLGPGIEYCRVNRRERSMSSWYS